MKKMMLAALAVAGTTMGMANEARADAACDALVTQMKTKLSPYGQGAFYLFEMTVHRTNANQVAYTSGYLTYNNNVYFPIWGQGTTLFSDRSISSQPFHNHLSEPVSLHIGANGDIWINMSSTYYGGMTCIDGNTFTRAIPSYGVVSLTLRSFNLPIP